MRFVICLKHLPKRKNSCNIQLCLYLHYNITPFQVSMFTTTHIHVCVCKICSYFAWVAKFLLWNQISLYFIFFVHCGVNEKNYRFVFLRVVVRRLVSSNFKVSAYYKYIIATYYVFLIIGILLHLGVNKIWHTRFYTCCVRTGESDYTRMQRTHM